MLYYQRRAYFLACAYSININEPSRTQFYAFRGNTPRLNEE